MEPLEGGGVVVFCFMRLLGMWDEGRSDASGTEMQCLRPLCPSGALLEPIAQ